MNVGKILWILIVIYGLLIVLQLLATVGIIFYLIGAQ